MVNGKWIIPVTNKYTANLENYSTVIKNLFGYFNCIVISKMLTIILAWYKICQKIYCKKYGLMISCILGGIEIELHQKKDFLTIIMCAIVASSVKRGTIIGKHDLSWKMKRKKFLGNSYLSGMRLKSDVVPWLYGGGMILK